MKLDERYLDLNYNGLHIQVKLEDEGVVLDVFKDDDNVATRSKFYEEFGLKIEEEWWIVVKAIYCSNTWIKIIKRCINVVCVRGYI